MPIGYLVLNSVWDPILPEDRSYQPVGPTTSPAPTAQLSSTQQNMQIEARARGTPPRSRYERTGKTLLVVSCTLTERHTQKATVTEHPVELGSSIADNRTVEPDSVDIDGVLSDILAYDEPPNSLDPSIGVFEQRPLVTEAYDALERLWYDDEPFDFVTGLRTYKNYLFTALSVVRDKDTGQVVRFTASAREILYAHTEEVAAVAAPKAQKVVPKKDAGVKNKKPMGPEKPKEKAKTGLQKLFNKFNGGSFRNRAFGE